MADADQAAPAPPAPSPPRPSAEALLRESIATSALDDRGFDPHEFRLSETGGCPRYRVAKAIGLAQPDRVDPDGILERGHVIGDWVVARLRRALRTDIRARRLAVRREVPVRTPYGTGHIDVLVTWADGSHLVEVKSTTEKHLHDLPRGEHLAQVQSYLHFRPAIRTAELLYVLVGTGLRLLSWPVARSETLGRGIEADLRLLSAYRDRGLLPPIPEEYSPLAFPCTYCPFREPCWAGADRPAAAPADDVAGPAARLKQAEELLAGAKADVERWEEVREREREPLRAAFERLGATEITAGGVRVRRTIVAGRRTVNGDGMVQAGIVPPDVVAQWTKQGEPFERWTVR